MIDAHRVTLASEDDFEGWRDAARDLAEAGVPPEAVVWRVDGAEDDLFATEAPQPRGASFAVPRAFIDLAKSVVCHSDPQRFASLYAMLWKLRSNRGAMEDRADPLLDRLERLAKEVRRDVHKMHAFVRFREVDQPDDTTRFVAFFEPEHHIVRHTAGFFVRRFTNMCWSILTPDLSIHWDGESFERRPGRDPCRGARRRSARGDVEDLLRVHLQPRPAKSRRDAQGDAEEILAQHAGDLARSAADCRCPREGDRDDRKIEER